MTLLAAAAVLVGLLAAANLLLTVGVVRRLREHTDELAALKAGGPAGNEVAATAGTVLPGFTATAVDGRPAGLGDRTLVGFFSPQCTPCQERLPGFVEYAATRPGGAGGVLAVVAGTAADAAEAVARLDGVATVVVEPDGGPVQTAFAVSGFPAFLLVEDGTVAASSYELGPVAERDAAVPAAAG